MLIYVRLIIHIDPFLICLTALVRIVSLFLVWLDYGAYTKAPLLYNFIRLNEPLFYLIILVILLLLGRDSLMSLLKNITSLNIKACGPNHTQILVKIYILNLVKIHAQPS